MDKLRVMITKYEGQWFATSASRIEVLLMPPLVDNPTLIPVLRLAEDGSVIEEFDGISWRASRPDLPNFLNK